MPLIPQTENQITTFQIDHLAASTGISDFNVGSSVRTFQEAVSIQIDQTYFQLVQLLNAYYLSTASGSDLDRRATDYGLQRQLPLSATVNVTFGGTNGTTVPAGTIISVPASGNTAEIDFITTTVGTVGSTPIPAIAVNAGSLGNVAASAITAIQNNPNPSLITSVTNTLGATGGQDNEQDSTFSARVIAYLSSLSKGTINAITSVCLNLSGDGITQVQILENYSLTYIDGGSQTTQDLNPVNPNGNPATLNTSQPGNIVVVIDNGTGSLPFPASGTPNPVVDAANSINGIPSDPTDFPGYRAAGIQAFITRPTVNPVAISLGVYVLAGFNSATVSVAIQTNLATFMAQLQIGGSLYLTDIIQVVMNTAGVDHMEPTGITAPLGDVTGAAATRLTLGTVTITIL